MKVSLILLAIFLLFVLPIPAFVDCFYRREEDFPGPSSKTKSIWTVIFIVTLAFGIGLAVAIPYYFVVYFPSRGRNKKG